MSMMMVIEERQPDKCTWVEDEDSHWDTSCGNRAILNMFSPSDNKMIYCWYCGLVLVEKPYCEPEADPA